MSRAEELQSNVPIALPVIIKDHRLDLTALIMVEYSTDGLLRYIWDNKPLTFHTVAVTIQSEQVGIIITISSFEDGLRMTLYQCLN